MIYLNHSSSRYPYPFDESILKPAVLDKVFLLILEKKAPFLPDQNRANSLGVSSLLRTFAKTLILSEKESNFLISCLNTIGSMNSILTNTFCKICTNCTWECLLRVSSPHQYTIF